jgi:hypothetical protein
MGLLGFDGNRAYGAGRIGNHAGLADGEEIELGGRVYEWDSGGGVADGNVAVEIGANAQEDVENLVEAINANPPEGKPVTAYVDPIEPTVFRIETDGEGARGNMSFTTTMADPANVIDAVDDKLRGGEDGISQQLRRGSYVVSSIDAGAGSLMIPTGVQNPRHLRVDVWAANGRRKTELTTKWSIDQARIKGDWDGAENPVAGDRVEWIVFG